MKLRGACTLARNSSETMANAKRITAAVVQRMCFGDRQHTKTHEPKTHTGFIDPTGQRVAITNLAEFCRQHGLHPVHMHQVKNGQRKSHKGWTWREEEEHGE